MAKYRFVASAKFKKQYKKLGAKDMELTKELLTTLLNGEELPPKNRDHALKGRFKECRECHIKPDLLMIYQKQEDILILAALQIGKHSELF